MEAGAFHYELTSTLAGVRLGGMAVASISEGLTLAEGGWYTEGTDALSG